MVSEKQLSLKRTVPFLLVGLLIFVAYLHFFVGIPKIVTIIQSINLFYYTLAVAILFVNMLINSLTWQFFLRPLSIKVPLRKTLLFTWVGVFVDLLVPAESISGDATKAYLMTKGSGEKAGKVLASVVSHRILSMIIPLGSLIFSFVLLYIYGIAVDVYVLALSLLVIFGIAISLFFIFLFSLKETLAQRLIDVLVRFLGFVTRGRLNIDRIKANAIKGLSAFHDSIDFLRRNPKSLVPPIVFGITGWFFSILMSYLVFVSLGLQVDFVIIIVVHSISVSIQSVPLGIPGDVGVVDTAMAWLYGLLAVDSAFGAAATVLIQILRVWLRIIVGFVAVQWIDLKDLTKHLRQDLS
ncbi:MAG: flippase-like domain-containing protein [Candidatus Bathyarchaeum sp.]|nr:MAG: flippase-like domain-containing protein [Candidatus Bathyarchaeum sp.]